MCVCGVMCVCVWFVLCVCVCGVCVCDCNVKWRPLRHGVKLLERGQRTSCQEA